MVTLVEPSRSRTIPLVQRPGVALVEGPPRDMMGIVVGLIQWDTSRW